ncbi:YdcF- like protein [Thioalkalivibrio nitratireducens DSM 14787]|uniref:YdcF-like protein n=1 Tax=Thioalkalivibrio nitratireducens (strain DSM 14787 / UNIQEM 213 / ALEN2) TaxID=1255043 RepID=L0DS68_THIND|nr:ElyC/SanA/YdcF family protein [Thioalkalivibrio nitratireducens]AGA32429.1 YdcF- like protein [Thioalkalivibrio nitratireducens DSM 14787]
MPLPDLTLVVSGGSRRTGVKPVAQGYAQVAQALGVPAERIVVLDTPTDTAQEAYAVRDLLGSEARFLLVTSASHMPRSVRHFERVGLGPIASPTHVLTGRGRPARLSYWVPSSDALRKTERAVYEYLGLRALEWDHRRGL